jgi:hypothetical protein
MTTQPKARPFLAHAPEVREILATGRCVVRRAIHWSNSTVLGYPAKPYWPKLLFEHAQARGKSSLMLAICGPDKAPPDVHLSVPFRDPDDEVAADWPIEDLGWYRVRPKWEVGDVLWWKETWASGAVVHRGDSTCFVYAADDDFAGRTLAWKWHPASSMLRHISRITATLATVAVERSDAKGWEWVREMIRVSGQEGSKP